MTVRRSGSRVTGVGSLSDQCGLYSFTLNIFNCKIALLFLFKYAVLAQTPIFIFNLNLITVVHKPAQSLTKETEHNYPKRIALRNQLYGQ